MNPTARRIAISALAWTAGATAAVAVSLLALSSINADTASGPPQQLTPDSLNEAVPAPSAAAPPSTDAASPAPSAGTSPARPTGGAARPTPSADSMQRQLSSSGGTVVARCTGASAYLVSWSPAQGFRAAHVDRGPAPEVRVIFRSTSSRTAIDAEIRCVAGIPTLDDDGHSAHGDD
jgi:hypothetical protein